VTKGTVPVRRAAYTGGTRQTGPAIQPGPSSILNQMQSSSPGSWSKTLNALINNAVGEIPADEVFMQTPQGALVATSMPAHLPDRLRMLLFLVNGRRRMSEYRDLLPRYRNLDDAFDMLAKKGFIKRVAAD